MRISEGDHPFTWTHTAWALRCSEMTEEIPSFDYQEFLTALEADSSFCDARRRLIILATLSRRAVAGFNDTKAIRTALSHRQACVAQARADFDSISEADHLSAIATDVVFSSLERIAAADSLVNICRSRGLLGEARAWCGRALSMARAGGHTVQWFDTVSRTAGVLYMTGNVKQAHRLLTRARRLVNEPGVERFRAGHELSRGLILSEMGENDDAAEAYRLSATLSRKAGNLPLAVRSLINLAVLKCSSGYWQDAVDELDEALAIASLLGDDELTFTIRTNLGACWRRLGQPDKSVSHFRVCLKIAEERGWGRAQASVHNNLAGYYGDRFDEVNERVHLERAAALDRRAGSTTGLAIVLCNLAPSLAKAGRFAEANTAVEEATAIYSKAGGAEGAIYVNRARAAVLHLQGRPKEALDSISVAVDAARKLESHGLLATSLSERAEIQGALGNHVGCLEDSCEAQSSYDQCETRTSPGYFLHLARWSQSLLETGDVDNAKFLATDALRVASELGLVKANVDRIQAALSSIRSLVASETQPR